MGFGQGCIQRLGVGAVTPQEGSPAPRSPIPSQAGCPGRQSASHTQQGQEGGPFHLQSWSDPQEGLLTAWALAPPPGSPVYKGGVGLSGGVSCGER